MISQLVTINSDGTEGISYEIDSVSGSLIKR
jgi:hypothetical protein